MATLLSIQEAAAELGVTDAHVRQLCHKGRIKCQRNPKSFRIEIRKSDFNKYVSKGYKDFGRKRLIDEN